MPRIFLLQQHLQSWQQELEEDNSNSTLKQGGLLGSHDTGTCTKTLWWREEEEEEQEEFYNIHSSSNREEEEELLELEDDNISVVVAEAVSDVVGQFCMSSVVCTVI